MGATRGWALAVVVGAIAAGGCTEVVDLWANEVAEGDDGPDVPDAKGPDGSSPDGDAEVGPSETVQDPCIPDPCLAQHKECSGGLCWDCLPGYVADEFGDCALDPTDPCEGCTLLNKECFSGFCGGCLNGFIEVYQGDLLTCVAPSACTPNPCKEPLKTSCALNPDGSPLCYCDPGAHDDGTGACTFDPCLPNPCGEAPFTTCVPEGPVALCQCAPGQVTWGNETCTPGVCEPCDDCEVPPECPDVCETTETCVDDPCDPNPCNGYAQTTCVPELPGAAQCACDPGFIEYEGGCIEGPIQSLAAVPGPGKGDLVIDDRPQLFVDDWFIASREGLSRRVHTLTRQGGWVVEPDLEGAAIGRARAAGSLVHVPEDVRAALPDEHPLKPYPWRLYTMGYRQLYAVDSQPSWLCVSAAASPEGPWVEPVLDEAVPASHCVLRDDGLVTAEVALKGGAFVLSVTRLPIGAVSAPGVYVYTSPDGVAFTPAASGPVLDMKTTAELPDLYARVGERTRLVWDPVDQRFVALAAVTSATLGDARAVAFGSADPTAGWIASPNAVQMPGVLGPTQDELGAGRVMGDMVAWRAGSVWLGLVQKRLNVCPKTAYVSLVSSRDGRHWAFVRDELTPDLDAILANAFDDGQPDTSIDSLTGGPPAAEGGLWHFFAGGVEMSTCTDAKAAGGVFRATVREGGFAGLEAAGGTNNLVTRPMRMAPGKVASRLYVNARVDGKLFVRVEGLTSIGTVTQFSEKILNKGDYIDDFVDLPPLDAITAQRFRVRMQLIGPGELFGFRFDNALCDPNPCTIDPLKPICDASTGEARCLCAPPLHDDGLGGCTDDPCLPDPCTNPHEQGCTAVDGVAVCGCEAGWVKAFGVCVLDPCLPQNTEDGLDPCQPPGPDRCKAEGGVATCYCPEGSSESFAGCVADHPRAFVTSLEAKAGDLNGVAGADSLCASLAFAAGLPGSYAAWLSVPGQDAISRFSGGGPWRTWDPEHQLWTQLVATDAADLVDGALAAPLTWTEFAQPASAACTAWTGTTPKGKAPPPLSTYGASCGEWTHSAAGGGTLVGVCAGEGEAWTAAEVGSCAVPRRVYCLQLP